MPLHTDYRPESLDSFLGNERTKESLKAILGSPDHPRTFLLFSGYGLGKTTLARIIRKELSCIGQDYKELNVGADRGIQSAREILADINYLPMEGKVKVYVLDECHLGTDFFAGAMLKVLEEPPDHVVFVLCTTDLSKLNGAWLNRCAKYELKPLTNNEIIKLLIDVLEKEKIDNFPQETLELITKQSRGNPREALVLLGQVINMKTKEGMVSLLTGKDILEEKTTYPVEKDIPMPEAQDIRKNLEKAEACQLFIQQEVESALVEGKKPAAIGRELKAWVDKVFKTNIPARTIEQRARRAKTATSVAKPVTIEKDKENQHKQELQVVTPETKPGPGRKPKYTEEEKLVITKNMIKKQFNYIKEMAALYPEIILKFGRYDDIYDKDKMRELMEGNDYISYKTVIEANQAWERLKAVSLELFSEPFLLYEYWKNKTVDEAEELKP